ncbi:hypothetical protein [Bacillus cereus]|uniref:hypothetical protein n=1 Tax=Bacillus cereus TaxID=1396 RepID=UPI000BF44C12|nr:hypothetical protein [Bacillus cereus]PFU19524.1 hypothetical protein COK76_30900 [Bacillus cereus]PGP57629.1 hypothetical protein COA04_29475 [Bacillus cereus]
MAKYKTLPNYEVIRPKLHIQFDSQGFYVTYDESEIEYLDGKSPFIERVDVPEAEEPPKPKPRAKAATKKSE